jgi:hypothetical protein
VVLERYSSEVLWQNDISSDMTVNNLSGPSGDSSG